MGKFDDVVKEVQKLLKDDQEWISRYNLYANELKERPNFKISDYIEIPKNLVACTSLTKNKKNVIYKFDLRFNGDNVAVIKIDTKEIDTKKDKIYLKLAKSSKAKEYFDGFETFEKPVAWHSNEAKAFRHHFSTIKSSEKFKEKEHGVFKINEHGVELYLKTAFAKNKKIDDIFRGIKPISLFGLPFQMPTPIKASDAKNDNISYSKHYGGGIDILCRVGRGKNTRLTVMELKDKQSESEEKNESPEKVMKQAICYATFIRELIRNDESNGSYWWEFFGFNGNRPEKLVINTVVAIPISEKNKNMDKSFANKIIDFDNSKDCLELHYFYYDYEDLNRKADTSLKGYDENR